MTALYSEEEELMKIVDNEELVDLSTDLPHEVQEDLAARNIKFNNETDLQEYLEEMGIGDRIHIVIFKDTPYQIDNSYPHKEFAAHYSRMFSYWAKNRWGCATTKRIIYLQNKRFREPDIAFFGYPNCQYHRGYHSRLLWPIKYVLPDVVIRVGWKNTIEYEAEAINDIMNCALEEECGILSTTLPRVGYLINVCFSKLDMVHSLDVYRLPNGTTVDDAVKGVNGAEKWKYFPGCNAAHSKIVITPHDLGITGFWTTWLCGNFEIPLAAVFSDMFEYQRSLQQEMEIVDNEELVDLSTDLPQEVQEDIATRNMKFNNETELQEYLEDMGIGDRIRVVIFKDESYQIDHSYPHREFASRYQARYNCVWAKNKWGCATNKRIIYLQNKRFREPSIAFFGYPNCDYEDRILMPKDFSLPDVVIQFGWKKTLEFEAEAINSMMNCALEHECGELSTSLPRVGYLINACFSTHGILHSLDIFKLPHGTTLDDAVKGVNSAEKWKYFPGTEDRSIIITPQDLGITGSWTAWWCGNFEISLSQVFLHLDNYNTSH